MDLSWPKGFLLMMVLKETKYLGAYFTLHYPSLDHITDALKHLGPQAPLYKIDISRAFRHLTIDPGDIDLLGLKHQKISRQSNTPIALHVKATGDLFYAYAMRRIHFQMNLT